MEERLFKLMLDALQPQTLAYLVRDLNDSLEEWQYYPEDAPPQPLQQELRQTLAVVMAVGTERAKAEGVDFAQLMKQTAADQEQDDWRWQRNQQVQQNWTDDLQ